MLLATRDTMHKLNGALVYGAAAAGTYNWVTYALNPERSYGYPVLLQIAFVGSLVLGIGCILSAFASRYGVIVGSLGTAISWAYFAPFAWSLPWRHFGWLFSFDLPWVVRNNFVDVYKLVAILLLVAATAYSVSKRRVWKPLPSVSPTP